MTLEEAKSQLLEIKKYNENFKKTFERRPGIVSTIKLKQLEKDNKAIKISIKSLDMWDKVVELINTKYGYILKATKYGNKNAEQQSFSYSNVLMYEVAAIIEDILDDIEEHKQEIEK